MLVSGRNLEQPSPSGAEGFVLLIVKRRNYRTRSREQNEYDSFSTCCLVTSDTQFCDARVQGSSMHRSTSELMRDL